MAASTRSSDQLQCKNLQDYLKTLPIPVLDRLYSHPATCLAVFRDLPLLARHYVMRILFVDKPVSHAVVTSWVNKENHSAHLAAVKALGDLRVWCEQSLPGGLPGWILSDTFRENLKIGLLGG
ncbi:General transcription factor IIH subunit 4 [Lamellibrachia satsuma]|nr:General transcription factor IIH subunit 4 [Lamellibrachia satsuma]